MTAPVSSPLLGFMRLEDRNEPAILIRQICLRKKKREHVSLILIVDLIERIDPKVVINEIGSKLAMFKRVPQ